MRWWLLGVVVWVVVGSGTACGSSHDADGDAGDRDAGTAGTAGVGAACRPLAVPMRDANGNGLNDGYAASESFVETGTGMCTTTGCLVFHIAGDPRPGCNPATSECSDPTEVTRRVYCSCRCAGPPGASLCTCPSSYVCIPVLELAMTPLEGSYCLRADTIE